MNKLTKLLSVFVIAGAIGTGVAGAVGCSNTPEPDPGPGGEHTTHNYTYKNNGDGTHDATCDGCDLVIDDEPHDFTNGNCVCGEQHTHKYTNVIDGNNGYHIKACDCGKTAGSYKLHNWNDETNKCADCGAEKNVEVKFELNVSDEFEAETSDEDRVSGIYTVMAGTQVRNKTPQAVYKNEVGGEKIADVPEYTKSVCINATASKLKINAPAKGKLIVRAANGSSPSSATGIKTLAFSTPSGGTTIGICSDDGSPCREVEVELSEPGEYTISRTGGTMDIYYLCFTCTVENTPAKEIGVVAEGVNKYFVGQEYAPDGLSVNKTTTGGAITPLDLKDKSVTIDSSAVDTSKAGVYPVQIIYNDGKDEFKTSYNVTVYAVESLYIGKDTVIKGSNSAAGNGVYANHHLRELYFTGNEFSTDGMTVKASASIGEGAQKETQVFTLKAKEYTLTGNDLSSTGKKTVTVTLNGTTVAETFEVYVMAPVDLSTAETVNVKVDATTNDTQVGLVADGAYQFQTIHQALEFLENCKAPASAKKKITLAAGLYTEKLEINVPNLTIEGAGTDLQGAYSMIEFDSLYGVKDDGGFEHVTDSTATLNVRDGAVGFTMKNVVVSNWFNCGDRFRERYGAKAEDGVDHRALAMLVQADKVTVENCTLKGYQDTLELFTGRHVFKDCLIEGVTDFIFGTNGTTYFTGCEIKNLKHLKNDASTPQVGYVTAFKGLNQGATTDGVKYGAIFDDCDFTAEEGIAKGCAFGRAWGTSAAVMIMNSRIGDHIATDSKRYVSMGNGNPEDAQFTEYNNTGASATTTIVKVGSKNLWNIPSETEAAKYADFEIIFGKTNGSLTYADAWEGSAGAEITTDELNFVLGNTPSETPAQYYADKATITGTASWNARQAGNVDGIQVSTDTVITFDKPGRVTIAWYPSYGTDADALITYDATGKATVKILTAQRYINKLTVNYKDVPAETQTCQVTFNLDYTDAPAATTKEVVVGGKVAEPEKPTRSGFNFLYWATDDDQEYDFDTVVSGTLTLKAVWQEMSEEEKNPVIGTNTSIVFGSANGNYKTLAAGGKVVIGGDKDPRDQSGETQIYSGTTITIKVNVGAKITVASYNNYTNYSVKVNGTVISALEQGTSYEYTVTANKTGEEYAEVVFESVSDNNYFYSISISYGLTEINASSEKKSFASTEGVNSTDLIEFTGVNSHNNGEYWNLGTTGTIKIKVAAGATVTLTCGYWGTGITINGETQDTSSSTITYTATQGGIITIGCINNPADVSYVQTITVSFD